MKDHIDLRHRRFKIYQVEYLIYYFWPVEDFAELSGGPTLYVRWQGQDLYSSTPI